MIRLTLALLMDSSSIYLLKLQSTIIPNGKAIYVYVLNEEDKVVPI